MCKVSSKFQIFANCPQTEKKEHSDYEHRAKCPAPVPRDPNMGCRPPPPLPLPVPTPPSLALSARGKPIPPAWVQEGTIRVQKETIRVQKKTVGKIRVRKKTIRDQKKTKPDETKWNRIPPMSRTFLGESRDNS